MEIIQKNSIWKKFQKYLSISFPTIIFFSIPFQSLAFFLILRKILISPASLGGQFLISVLSLIIYSLILRIMDDLKDYKSDMVNFPQRALPKKIIEPRLLVYSLYALCLFVTLINFSLPQGKYNLIILLYSLLMYKWFYLKRYLQNNILLALITHHPIIFFHSLYLANSLFPNAEIPPWPLFLYLLPITNLEISRKIRRKSEEDAYQTYSKFLGENNSLVFGAITQFLFWGLCVYYWNQLDISVWKQVLLIFPAFLLSVVYLFYKKTKFKVLDLALLQYVYQNIALIISSMLVQY